MLDDYLTYYDDIARLSKNLFEYENVPSTMNIDNLESELILYGQVRDVPSTMNIDNLESELILYGQVGMK